MNPAAVEKQQLLDWIDGQEIAHPSNATLRQLQKLAYENGSDRPTSPVVPTKSNASANNDIPADPNLNLENDADTLAPVIGEARIPEEEELDAAIRILQKIALLTKLMAEGTLIVQPALSFRPNLTLQPTTTFRLTPTSTWKTTPTRWRR
ncbi:GL13534 [Drosophila persimilis]|uniref:GL13534 n=1 Tax=Drosophila persimilis TaxID=7234 RepID=B4HCU2_DROPE|nr:GL13534 [Drosophila persimilis]